MVYTQYIVKYIIKTNKLKEEIHNERSNNGI